MWTRLTTALRHRLTDYTPGVGRVFLICKDCHRVQPYYRLYGPAGQTRMGCACGCPYVKPATIPEWKAAWWLLWSAVRRKGDPRMPYRTIEDRYA